MNSKERVQQAMQLQAPDRIPVMCQLSIGHYYLNASVSPLDIWFTSKGFAEALVELQRRYRFDGILVNLPGRDPEYEKYIESVETSDSGMTIHWKNGAFTDFPLDDVPHYHQKDGAIYFPEFQNIEPEDLFYIDPWDLTGINYPFAWGFDQPRSTNDFFPGYHLDTIKYVKELAGETISLHSEIFSPWSQFLELFNYEGALIAIMDDPGKVKSCLDRLTEGAAALAKLQASAGVDAILISSAFAGAGLISRDHYREFVLPYEQKLINTIKAEKDIVVYTHTCGAIGDRLDLMLDTGTNGIDTLDPPPLGTVELKEAKEFLNGKVFIKGNINPVDTLLHGNTDKLTADVIQRIKTGKPGGGYILSSACSVAPYTPPENLELLAELAETHGQY